MANSAPQPKPDTTVLRGTKVTAVNLEVLKRSAKKLKLPVDKTDRDAMIVSLAEYFVKLHQASPDDVLACDACGGPSDESFDACPYCGEKGVDAEPTKPNGTTKSDAEAEKPAAHEMNPGATPAEAKPIKAPKGETKAKTKKLSVVQAPEPEVHKAEIVSAAALDDSVAAIKATYQNLADGHYELGRLLAENWEKNLYTLRVNEQGKQKYKSWGQWVEAECGIGPRHALDLIAVSQTFTKQDIAAVGVTKLRPMCRIPDEAKRANLLERAKGELTRNEIEQESKKIIEESGRPPVKQKGRHKGGPKPKTKAVASVATPEPSPVFTVVLQEARHVQPAYLAERPDERATALNGLPIVSRFQAVNDVQLIVSTVVDEDGNVSHSLEFVRPAESVL